MKQQACDQQPWKGKQNQSSGQCFNLQFYSLMMTLMNAVIATINKCSTCTCQLGAKLKWDLCSAPARHKTSMMLHSGASQSGQLLCDHRLFLWPGLMNHPILHSVLNSCVEVLDAKWSCKVPVLSVLPPPPECCINKSFSPVILPHHSLSPVSFPSACSRWMFRLWVSAHALSFSLSNFVWCLGCFPSSWCGLGRFAHSRIIP